MPAGEAQAEVDRSGDRTYHLSSLPGLESRPLAMRVWNPNAWTTREFPVTLFFLTLFSAGPDLRCYMVGFSLVVVCGLLTAGLLLWTVGSRACGLGSCVPRL